jgi:hypothetical protein
LLCSRLDSEAACASATLVASNDERNSPSGLSLFSARRKRRGDCFCNKSLRSLAQPGGAKAVRNSKRKLQHGVVQRM